MPDEEPDEPSLPAKALAETADLAGLVPYVGTAVEYLLNKIPQVREVRAARMLRDLLEVLDMNAGELVEVLQGDERFVDLVADAAEGAARSRLEQKVLLLARVAHDAIKSGDQTEIDTAHLRLNTIADLEAIHLSVLRGIAVLPGSQVRADELRTQFAGQVGLDAVVATLVRHGLLGVRDALVGFAGPVYNVTEYGRYILELFGKRSDESSRDAAG